MVCLGASAPGVGETGDMFQLRFKRGQISSQDHLPAVCQDAVWTESLTSCLLAWALHQFSLMGPLHWAAQNMNVCSRDMTNRQTDRQTERKWNWAEGRDPKNETKRITEPDITITWAIFYTLFRSQLLSTQQYTRMWTHWEPLWKLLPTDPHEALAWS